MSPVRLGRRSAAARADGTGLDPEEGAAVAEWVMVMGLLLALVYGVIQICLVLHTHNLLVSDAQEGARYGANADIGYEAGVARAKQRILDTVGPSVAGTVKCYGGVSTTTDGRRLRVVEITCEATYPVFFGAGVPMTVRGHAVEESQ